MLGTTTTLGQRREPKRVQRQIRKTGGSGLLASIPSRLCPVTLRRRMAVLASASIAKITAVLAVLALFQYNQRHPACWHIPYPQLPARLLVLQQCLL
jgi:hypothetical protein